MKKKVAVLIVLAIAVIAYLLWGRGHHGKSKAEASAQHHGSGAGGLGAAAGHPDRAMEDLAKKPHASIAGTVREKGGGPLAGAQVCTVWHGKGIASQEVREPLCTTTTTDGSYQLADVVPATHNVSASAPGHAPRTWIDLETRDDDLVLRPGEHRTGIDIALAPGGVQVSGTVLDVSGGPIAGALVRTGGGWWWGGNGGAFTHSDAQGHFSLWAKPGELWLSASADGYADGSAESVAPTAKAEIFLTPESVLAGTVIEADTKAPVVGAMVKVGGDWRNGDGDSSESTARTDAQGRFRLTGLTPGRYKPSAQARNGFGEPTDSVLLGLGQTVEDVVIELHAAATVRGKVAIDLGDGKTQPCDHGHVYINDEAAQHWEGDATDPDGKVEMTSVLPGHYEVNVGCAGYVPKDHYDAIDVARTDLDGLVWTLSSGGKIIGHVATSDGKPVADAWVNARTINTAARGQRSWGGSRTDDDGSFELRGLIAGDYEVSTNTREGIAPDPGPTTTVPAGGTVTQDIVVDTGGSIAGSVSDSDGAPAGNVNVRVANDGWRWDAQARTGDDGTFLLKAVRPGVKRVVATRGWSDEMRKPGTSDDDVQGERVTVAAGKTATVHLVVEKRGGTIRGTVKDHKGQAIGDSWVIAVRESERTGAASGGAARESRWSWGRDDRPVITGTDGTFTVRDLAPGSYSLRAYRKGGGEALAEHVAVGSSVSLVIRATGTLAGTVVAAGGTAPPEEFYVRLSDEKTGVSRSERFYQTGGAFSLRDLPAGDFQVSADAAYGRATAQVTLATGEEKRDLRLTLEAKVKLRGRVVALATTTPVPAMRAGAEPVKNGMMISFGMSDGEKLNISGDDGRFELDNVPIGKLYVMAFPVDWRRGEYGWGAKVVTVAAGQTEIDVGDVEVVKRRVKPGETEGDLGFTMVESPPDQDPETAEMKIAVVRPHGPADGSGLVAGDVIVSVDGHDVRGARSMIANTLMEVLPGTKIALGLARGATVTIEAGPPL